MDFNEKWLQAIQKKNSLLCVNIDPAEWGQRDQGTLSESEDKCSWISQLIEKVAPFASGIKINRQYIKDLSRSQAKSLNHLIHQHDMISIDDSKIADIGDTNDAALYHAAEEGFDAVTYAPFPGNIAATCKMAKNRNIGLIPLVLMSNPEYELIKNSTIQNKPGYVYIAEECAASGAHGVVIGAPSEKNHLSAEEISLVRDIVGDKTTALVPGIGAQGGDIEPILKLFGDMTIASVGRAIAYAQNPAKAAEEYQKMLASKR